MTSTAQPHGTDSSKGRQVHHRRVSMVDVARRAGVSQSTVSYVLSGSRSISEDVRLRVAAAVDELGYRPSASARALRGASTGILSLSVPAFTEFRPGIAQFEHALALAARTAGFNLLLLSESDAVDGLNHILSSGLTDGVIVGSVTIDDERLQLLRDRGVPFVAFGVARPDQTNTVDLDFDTAVRHAVGLMAEHGFRRIAFVPQSNEEFEAGHAYVASSITAFRSETVALGVAGTVISPFRDRAALEQEIEKHSACDAFVTIDPDNLSTLLAVLADLRPDLDPWRALVTIGPRAAELRALPHAHAISLSMEEAARVALEQIVGWIETGEPTPSSAGPVLIAPRTSTSTGALR